MISSGKNETNSYFFLNFVVETFMSLEECPIFSLEPQIMQIVFQTEISLKPINLDGFICHKTTVCRITLNITRNKTKYKRKQQLFCTAKYKIVFRLLRFISWSRNTEI